MNEDNQKLPEETNLSISLQEYDQSNSEDDIGMTDEFDDLDEDSDNISEDDEDFDENGQELNDENGDNEDDEAEIRMMKKARKSAKKPKPKLSDAMAMILGTSVSKSDREAPILAKSKALTRAIESEKQEYNARKFLIAERKKTWSKDRVLPDVRNMDYEKRLRKVATRGVVKLFNAIKAAQQKSNAELESSGVVITPSTTAKVSEVSKSTFFELLQKQSSAKSFQPNVSSSLSEFSAGVTPSSTDIPLTAPALSVSHSTHNELGVEQTSSTAGKSWSVLSDNYMLDAQLKDWDREVDIDL